MLRFTPIEKRQAGDTTTPSRTAATIFRPATCTEWGQGCGHAGLSGTPDYEQFKRLIHDWTSYRRSAHGKLIEDRLPGWDCHGERTQGREHGPGARDNAHPRGVVAGGAGRDGGA